MRRHQPNFHAIDPSGARDLVDVPTLRIGA
jgi:hypothetical protein